MSLKLAKSNSDAGDLSTAKLSLWKGDGQRRRLKRSGPKCPLVPKLPTEHFTRKFQTDTKTSCKPQIKCCDETLTHTCAEGTSGPACYDWVWEAVKDLCACGAFRREIELGPSNFKFRPEMKMLSFSQRFMESQFG